MIAVGHVVPSRRPSVITGLVLVAAAASMGSVDTAAGTSLPLRPVEIGRVERVFAAAGGAVAWTDPRGRVTVQHDDGRRVRVRRPLGCGPRLLVPGEMSAGLVAAGGGRLLFGCASADLVHRLTFAVTDLRGRSVVRRTVWLRPKAYWVEDAGVGARWVRLRFRGDPNVRRYVDWRTGEVQDAVAGARGFADERETIETLSARRPRQRVCAPIRLPRPAVRHRFSVALTAAAAGPYVATWRARGAALLVHRCGQRRPVVALPSYRGREIWATLTAHWLAYARPWDTYVRPHGVGVARLADGRRFTVATPSARIRELALTRRYVYLTGDGFDGLARAMLPQARRHARSDARG